MEKFIKKFDEITIKDISEVGGKNASLGEMYRALSKKGLHIPYGFAITAAAYQAFIKENKLEKKLSGLLQDLDRKQFSNLSVIGAKARRLILNGQIMADLAAVIKDAYQELCEAQDYALAVRSSATAEDLPGASFAGLHESYLNVQGLFRLLKAIKQCYASLYTDRAIKYREDKGFEHEKVFLSVGVQVMVRSDQGCSGVGFTLEPESGFRDVIHLEGTWGLGENVVQGTVTPDEFLIFKPSLKNNKKAIIQKNLGSKNKTLICAKYKNDTTSTFNKDTPWELRGKYILEDHEIELLASWAMVIEDHYQQPMDFEWAKDGITGQLFIIQARPETVHSRKKELQVTTCQIKERGDLLTSGAAIGSQVTCGTARLLKSPSEAGQLNAGDILITDTVSPDWDPILKKVAGIITNRGGRTSHAAIIARELGTLAIVGTENATRKIKEGEMVTMSCAEGNTGFVYQGKMVWTETKTDVGNIKLPDFPKMQFVISDPARAFDLSFYPNHGVGLVRMEFIITNHIQVHPMALLEFNAVKDGAERVKIENLTLLYKKKEDYFVDKLAQGIATIAAAFYPKEVIVRTSDFKTNEYAGLTGGRYFEPEEENPMIGFRGASRYYHERYQKAFRLECEAIKIVRDQMGLTNVKLMIPFCRTVSEGEKVIALMTKYGLKRGKNDLQIYVMAEIPSNVLLAAKFAQIFDGFSIGSNDLTQLTLGIDRDSALVADIFDEQNEASKLLITTMIEKANYLNKKIGICGQAPGDSPEFTRYLIAAGIDSIAFSPDKFLDSIQNIGRPLPNPDAA